jgi:hypothetical protein
MAYDPRIFNINPYYDDFDADKGFLRVLFKPGYALQARELTQLQTILQDQVSKIGDHLFKDGSRIVGGGISVRNSSYVRVSVGADTALEGITDYSTLVGGLLVSGTTTAKVVHFIAPDPDTDNYLVLVIDYVSGSALGNSFDFQKDSTTLTSLAVPSVAYSTAGNCKLVSVADGIFYIDGFFVRVDSQYFTPYVEQTSYRDLEMSAFSQLSKKIGFSVSRDSVTEQEDSTLRDPAIGSYNYNAPGADRYKIVLSLSQAELTETPNDFVELLRFEGGRVTKKVDRVTYGDIENALARRTYDQSGSYTVKPFDISLKSQDSSNLSLSLGRGKAYVFGYEVENVHPQTLSLPKAQTTQTESGLVFQYAVGNYMGVCAGAGTGNPDYSDSFSTNIVTIGSGSASVVFRNAANATIATCRVHGALPTPERAYAGGATGYHYRLYFYGLSGNPVNATKGNIYNASGVTIGSFLPQTGTQFGAVQGADDSSLVYELKPGYAVDSVSSLKVHGKIIGDVASPVTVSHNSGTNRTTYTISKSHFAVTISTSNDSVYKFFNYGTSNTNLSDISQISFLRSNSIAYTPNNGTLSVSADLNTITLTNVSSAGAGFTGTGGSLIAAVPVVYTPTLSDTNTYRTKTSTTRTQTFTSTAPITDENGRKYFALDRTDVYSVSTVTFSTGTPAVVTDVTELFELDDGQREAFYDVGRLYIKESEVNNTIFTTTARTLTVSYLHFTHGGLASAPFIGKHSYVHPGNPGFEYSKIPLYTNPRTGKTVSLANCLDFRRSSATSTTPMIKPYGSPELSSAQATEVSYSHYLPRIDKLCVKADPEDGSPLFYTISGKPDLSPTAPPDPADGLVLATLTVPAFTHNPTDVVITPVESKRFTMADIGKIEKRVDEVEVFAKLSLSEAELEARSLKATASDTEPLKTSIFSDEFYGHSVADVSDGQFQCSIDYERGELRPFFRTENINLATQTVSGTTVSADGLVTLDYSAVSYIQNSQYTKRIKINPSNTVNWLGFMNLSTSVEPNYDTGYRPVVKTNALKENDNWISCNTDNDRGFGTQWNEWESLWTGIEVVEEEQDDIQRRIVELPHSSSDSAIPSVNSGNVRVGISRTVDSIDQKNSNYIRTKKLKNRIKESVESRTIDRSVVPYIPVNTSVTAQVYGLKPNATGLSLYFDGQPIKTGIATDANGSCTVNFGISAGTYLAGSKSVRISDSADTANSTISAEAVYHCTGVLQQRDSGCFSTRPAELRRQSTSSETISKDPFNREVDVVETSHWSDPLCQTFFVDRKTNPSGVFLNSVSLYFASKDSTLPVTVQIRPTVSGYPSPSVVIPFSTVTKLPADVNADNTAPTETEFVFSSPVYLEPGEYAICVLANSDGYELFAADSSINGFANEDATIGRAGNNQLVGTLFTPQGIGPAVEDNVTDLMFSVKRCEFVSNGFLNYASVTSATSAQVLKFYAPEIVPDGTAMTRTVGSGSVSVNFLNNESLYMNTLLSGTPTLRYTMTRGANTAVSPVVDIAAMYKVAVKMFSTRSSTQSRYISRVVELPEDLASNGLAVFVDSNIPTGASISVYYRYSVNGEADIFTKPWRAATRVTPAFTSSSEIDFREVYFRAAPTTDQFKSYQVRVDLVVSAANPTYYRTPSARNIRTVSFIQ